MAIIKNEFHASQRANFDSIVALNVDKGISDKITSAITITDLEIKIRQISTEADNREGAIGQTCNTGV